MERKRQREREGEVCTVHFTACDGCGKEAPTSGVAPDKPIIQKKNAFDNTFVFLSSLSVSPHRWPLKRRGGVGV